MTDRGPPPRTRAELDRIIAELEAKYGANTRRYNALVATIQDAEAELARLAPMLRGIEHDTHDLDFEYYRRLQLDGVLPTIARRVFFDESRLDVVDDDDPYVQGVDDDPARG